MLRAKHEMGIIMHPVKALKRMARSFATQRRKDFDSTRGTYVEEVIKRTSTPLPKSTGLAAAVAGSTAVSVSGPVQNAGPYRVVPTTRHIARDKSEGRGAAAIRKVEDIMRALESEQNEMDLQCLSFIGSDGELCNPQSFEINSQVPAPRRERENSLIESDIPYEDLIFQRLTPYGDGPGSMCDPRIFITPVAKGHEVAMLVPPRSPADTRAILGKENPISVDLQRSCAVTHPHCASTDFLPPGPLSSHPPGEPGYGEPGWKTSNSFVQARKHEASKKDKAPDKDKVLNKEENSDKGERKRLRMSKSLRSIRSKFVEMNIC